MRLYYKIYGARHCPGGARAVPRTGARARRPRARWPGRSRAYDTTAALHVELSIASACCRFRALQRAAGWDSRSEAPRRRPSQASARGPAVGPVGAGTRTTSNRKMQTAPRSSRWRRRRLLLLAATLCCAGSCAAASVVRHRPAQGSAGGAPAPAPAKASHAEMMNCGAARTAVAHRVRQLCKGTPTTDALLAAGLPSSATVAAAGLLERLGFETALDLRLLVGAQLQEELAAELKTSGLSIGDRAKIQLLVGDGAASRTTSLRTEWAEVVGGGDCGDACPPAEATSQRRLQTSGDGG
eukprot:SAG31_NODE_4713_length_3014_cov_13.907033_1_plen_298_part_00